MPTSKKDSNYLLFHINIGYDSKLVLPCEDGVALMNVLNKAEIYKAEYKEPVRISDITEESIRISIIGAQEYAEAKLSRTLLDQQ